MASTQQDGEEAKTPIKRNWKITDIFTWMQCFAMYVSMHSTEALKAISGADGLYGDDYLHEQRIRVDMDAL